MTTLFNISNIEGFDLDLGKSCLTNKVKDKIIEANGILEKDELTDTEVTELLGKILDISSSIKDLGTSLLIHSIHVNDSNRSDKVKQKLYLESMQKKDIYESYLDKISQISTELGNSINLALNNI